MSRTQKLNGFVAASLRVKTLNDNPYSIFRCRMPNRLRVNIKHFLGPILGAEVAQKRAPFPAVVTITEMGNANICIL